MDYQAAVEKLHAKLQLSASVTDARRPVLVIMTGLPGSGKTHLAHALCERGRFTLVGSDPLRAALFEEPRHTPSENRFVYEVADALIWRLLRERRDVIYDAVNLSERRRRMLRTLALDAGGWPLTVLTTASEALIKARLAERCEIPPVPGDSLADWDVYRKLASRTERVAHQHVLVDTGKDINPAVVAILDEIARGS